MDRRGILRRPDGSFVVASFGFGTEGAIFKIAVPGYAVSKLATVLAVDLLTQLPGAARTSPSDDYTIVAESAQLVQRRAQRVE